MTAPFSTTPRECTALGTPQSNPTKCVSWICRSIAGPPLREASAISLDQSGLEITRLKWAARRAP